MFDFVIELTLDFNVESTSSFNVETTSSFNGETTSNLNVETTSGLKRYLNIFEMFLNDTYTNRHYTDMHNKTGRQKIPKFNNFLFTLNLTLI